MKNPFDTMSPRLIRGLYALFAACILSLCVLNFLDIMVWKAVSNDQCEWIRVDGREGVLRITNIVAGGVADQAGLKDGDLLLKIDGRSFKADNAMRLINRHRAGEYAVYHVERGGRVFETSIRILKTFNIIYFSQFLLGFGFLLVGLFVVMVKPNGKLQRRFARYGILSMFFFGLSSLYIEQSDPSLRVDILKNAFLAARVIVPPTFISFFLFFPVRKRLAGNKWFMALLYALSALVVPLFVFSLPVAVKPILQNLAILIGYAMFLTGFGVFIHSYFRSVKRDDRRRLRPIMQSVLVGMIAFVYTIIISRAYPLAIFINPIVLLPAILIIGVPPAFGYAVIRYGLMDVALIVKRSLIYGVITTAIAAIYLLFVFGIGNLVGEFIGLRDNRVLTVIAFVLIAFLFDPLKRRTQDWVDRFFDRERSDYQKALLEFSQELPRHLQLQQILELMVDRISSIMHVEKVGVALCSEKNGSNCVARNIDVDDCHFGNEKDGLVAYLRSTRRPLSFALPPEERDALPVNASDKEKILRAGIMLCVPMFLSDTLIGIINVGPKRSETVYSQEDVDLLATVASQAAISIENARLHESEIEKQKIVEELALARKIQIGLLPKRNPVIRGLEISGMSRPALSVGGDYFDFLQLSPTQVLVVVGDVAGKGIPAALYMSKVQGMIQLAVHMHQSPKDILTSVNRRIYDGIERNSFITMILALFDTERKEVTLCRAGHTLPVIGANGDIGYIDTPGIGLGLEQGEIFDARLEEFHRPYRAGEVFLFYTDGLTETMNPGLEEYGQERFLDLIRKNSHRSAREIETEIFSTVSEFRGAAEQHDDLTLVVVKTLA